MRGFPGVTVGFPAGGARPANVDWSSMNTNWVIWATGELRLDTASFALFFTPDGGARGLAAKPLGCLQKVVPMPSVIPGEGRSFIATTNDHVHGAVRLGFSRPADEDAFLVIAQGAEAASSGRFFDQPGRRSSMCASAANIEASDRADELTMHIREQHPDKWLPLVCAGCELYGPQPGGDPSVEVLLGRGAVVLLDPKDLNRVGNFEIAFYDESSPSPLLRMPIGSHTSVMLQPQDNSAERLSVARRMSARPAGAGAAYDFTSNGTDVFTFSFDCDIIGDSFARDLTVRVKLAALSQKTWRGKRAVAGLQGELDAMRSRGIFATIRRWCAQVLLVCCILLAMHGSTLYMAEPERPLGDLAQKTMSDAFNFVALATTTVKDAGARVCQMTAHSVSTADLQRCTTLFDSYEIRDCVNGLVETRNTTYPGFAGLGDLSSISESIGNAAGFGSFSSTF